MSYRAATPADAAAISRLVGAGFDGYREFAGPDWRQPHAPIGSIADVRARLADPRIWSQVFEHDGQPAGVVAIRPLLTERQSGEAVPGVANLWLLFVAREWWGRGVAVELHTQAIAEMRNRGYDRAELRTPTAASRARRFYERAGWSEAGSLYADPLDLDLTIYELDLDA